MPRHVIGRQRAKRRPVRSPRTVPRQYGSGTTATWHQHAGRFAAQRLYRVNSNGSSVTGGRRRDQTARSH